MSRLSPTCSPHPPPPPSTIYHQRSLFYPSDWRPQPPNSSLFAGALGPSSWANAGPSNSQSLWPNGPPEFLLPFHHYSSRDCNASAYSVARSDTSSAVSRDSDLSPSPEVAEVVCNAPLVAPIPLPYHSPTFLLYDLPDEDEDLSHPPYTHRPSKRKRARDDDDEHAAQEDPHPIPAKRRSIVDSSQSWSTPVGPWANTAAAAPPTNAPRHPAASFSRRNRAR
ncbi:hypothetical protein C8Q80DRAFT_1270444 [Daedaleopsis nitida]|nr:hypothetical protein C8Q80DRAFT_1270444 [Daedaleopsis nitida]